MQALASIDKPQLAFFHSLFPQQKWSPSEWAENERELSPEESSEPGKYRFDRTPYWRFVADLIARPGIEELVCKKIAQCGWSETCRNILGYWTCIRPDQCLVLMPDKNAAQAFREERMEPLMRHTPAIARLISTQARNTKKNVIRFINQMRIFFTYSGSKTGTKSRPIRYLICEEPDEFVKFSSAGGDPLSKAEKRLTTYRDKGLSRILLGGTPTTRKGITWRRWELCAVRYHFWVPCPHCGHFQLPKWNQVKYEPAQPGESLAQHSERIKSTGAAWYECESCKQRIHDHHKPGMFRAGKWATEDQVVTPDGRIVGPERPAKRVGVNISFFMTPWVTLPLLASEWIEAQADVESLADFINQRLAEPFEQQVEAPREDEFTAKRDRAIHENIKPGIVPHWTGFLALTVDVQQSGMWCMVVAWGWRYRSRLIWYGYVHSFDEVYNLAVNRLWEVESPPKAQGTGSLGHGPPGQPKPEIQHVRVQMCLLDSGGGTALDHRESRTQEVYRFVERAPGFFIPIKGASTDQIRTVRASPTAKDANGKPVPLYTINTQRLKDELMRLVRVPPGGEGEMQFHSEVDEEFLKQMVSEHKVRHPDGSLRWQQKGSMPNHLWDTYVYQVAAADPDLGRVGLLPSPEQIELERQQQQQLAAQRAAQQQQQGANRPVWMPPTPKNWLK